MAYLQLGTEKSKFYIKKIGLSGPSVVCLHGFGNSSKIWLPFVFKNIHRFQFYLVDFPGFGKSSAVTLNDEKVLEEYAKCIHLLIESINKPVILAGFSLGAYSSLQYFKTYGSLKICRYMHIDHTPYSQHSEMWQGGLCLQILSAFTELIELVEQNTALKHVSICDLPSNIKQKYTEVLKLLGEKSLTRPVAKIVNNRIYNNFYLREILVGNMGWPWAYQIFKLYVKGHYDFRGYLNEIKTPTLVVHAGKSELFAKGSYKFLLENIADSKGIVFEKSGHDLMFCEFIKFQKTFSDFLNNRF